MKFKEIRYLIKDPIESITITNTTPEEDAELVTTADIRLDGRSGERRLLNAIFMNSDLVKAFGDLEVEGIYNGDNGIHVTVSSTSLIETITAMHKVVELLKLPNGAVTMEEINLTE